MPNFMPCPRNSWSVKYGIALTVAPVGWGDALTHSRPIRRRGYSLRAGELRCGSDFSRRAYYMMLVLEPPAQYDHAFHGHVIEQRLSQLQIIFLCHGFAPACSWVSKGVCHIAFSVNEKDDRVIALMRQHEVGHCNGWPAYHPGGRWVDVKSGNEVPAPKSGHLKWGLF
jgi:hypothetical protein